MKEFTHEDYLEFVKNVPEIGDLEIGEHKEIKQLQPKDFKLEATTIWDFPEHDGWATHSLNARFRANWDPEVARNLILRYSKEGDVVLDAFVGSGTTLIECKLTGRKGVGVDINKQAIMLTRDRLNFEFKDSPYQKTYVGDARDLNSISDESIDLIATHPPYLKFIFSTKSPDIMLKGDLSDIKSVNEFAEEMKKIAKEFFRVLKPGKHCAVLMGDAKHRMHQIPVSFRVMDSFLDAGFILKEDVIKVQHNSETTPELEKMSVKSNSLLLTHEHLFVFRKPEKKEK